MAIGYQAGSGITSGANNVILGNYSGTGAPINATGNNWIVLADGGGNIAAYYNQSAQTWTFPNPNASISTATGAIVVAGGIGVGDSINVANTASASNMLINFGPSNSLTNINNLSLIHISEPTRPY